MHLQEIIKEQLRQIKVIIKVLLTPKDSLVRNLMKILIRKESYPKVNIYLASILVFFIILTDNFEKIGLIRVLKVAFKL